MLRRLLHGIGANAFGQISVAAIQLSLVPVLASHWGVSLYGVWLLLATVPVYLALGDFGFATSAGTDMTMKVARGAHEAAGEVFHSATAVTLAGSGLLLAVALAAAWLIPDRWLADPAVLPPSQARITLGLLVGYGLTILQGSLFFAGFRCDGRYAVGALCGSLQYLLEGLAVIAVVLLGGGPAAAAACYLGCRIAGLVAQALLLRRLVPWLTLGVSQASMAQIRKLVRPSLAVMAVPGGLAVILQGTALAVGAGAGVSAVAAFSSVRTLTRIGVQATSLVNNAVMPEFSATAARGDQAGLSRLVALTLATSAATLLPIAIALLTLGPKIIDVWTHGTIAAPWPLIALMTAVMLVNGVWLPLSNLILALNRQALYSYPYLALAILSLPVTYLLSIRFGAAGGALALLAIDLLMAALVATLVTRGIARPAEVIRAFAAVARDEAVQRPLAALRARLAGRIAGAGEGGDRPAG